MEPRALARLAPARATASTPACSARARPQPRLPRASRRCGSMDFDAAGFWWLEPNDADEQRVRLRARAPADGERVLVCVGNLSPVPRTATASGCRAPAAGSRCSTRTPRTTAARTSATSAASRPSRSPWHGQPFSAEVTLPAARRRLARPRGPGVTRRADRSPLASETRPPIQSEGDPGWVWSPACWLTCRLSFACGLRAAGRSVSATRLCRPGGACHRVCPDVGCGFPQLRRRARGRRRRPRGRPRPGRPRRPRHGRATGASCQARRATLGRLEGGAPRVVELAGEQLARAAPLGGEVGDRGGGVHGEEHRAAPRRCHRGKPRAALRGRPRTGLECPRPQER